MKTIITLAFFSIATSAYADNYNSYVEQKREQAVHDKLQFMQEIQHKQSNPEALLDSLNRKATPQTASFKASANGHYYVPATINNKASINFIADTGASSIFLTQNDAKLVGIDYQNLNYNKNYNTANGTVKAAETTAKSIKVGGIELTDIPVSVSSQQTGQSLLGMTFFSRLSRYSVDNNTLTLFR